MRFKKTFHGHLRLCVTVLRELLPINQLNLVYLKIFLLSGRKLFLMKKGYKSFQNIPQHLWRYWNILCVIWDFENIIGLEFCQNSNIYRTSWQLVTNMKKSTTLFHYVINDDLKFGDININGYEDMASWSQVIFFGTPGIWYVCNLFPCLKFSIRKYETPHLCVYL